MDYHGINIPNLFAFVNDLHTQQLLTSLHNVITRCNLWEWMSDYEPERGFMYDNSKEMKLIIDEMNKDDNNSSYEGSSYAYILREMQHIATVGYTEYEVESAKTC